MALDESESYRGLKVPQHSFDQVRLEAWLTRNVAGFRGPLEIGQFKGGQSNPTYKLTTPSRDYVLRRKPPGELLPSAHAVDREFKVLKALAGTGVPVPGMHVLCEDTAVIGSVFYVMDFVEGRVFWDQRLPGLTPADRAAVFEQLNAGIASLHLVYPAAVGLSDFGRPGNYMERQIGRWSKQYRASEMKSMPAMDQLIDWLPRHVPLQGETRIVHGDYRLDNTIFHESEPRLLAILDWELSTLGDPIADFAYHCMAWRVVPELFRGLAGIDFGVLGIPTEEAYVQAYCRRTGRSEIPYWDFYMVYSLFRIAAILQGIAKRALDGTAASARAVEVGKRARPLAEQAWALADKLAP